MITLIQRVSEASVTVQERVVGSIGRGILALIGIERGDDLARAERLLERVLTYRIFEDDGGRMNLSLVDIGGGLLLVPQFTLAADTHKGTRPGFSTAETPDLARALFEKVVAAARAPSAGRSGSIRRAHAGGTDQRRAGNFLATISPRWARSNSPGMTKT